jgi:hypothetical protein
VVDVSALGRVHTLDIVATKVKPTDAKKLKCVYDLFY